MRFCYFKKKAAGEILIFSLDSPLTVRYYHVRNAPHCRRVSNEIFLQETVKVFLKHPSVKDDSDLEGRTSFMWAAGKGSDDVLRTMLSLKSDIDINMADKYGGTGGSWHMDFWFFRC